LNKQELLEEASDLCLENAKKLIKDAELLFAFKSYGSALALVTIGNEEVGKAVIYKLLSQGLITEKSIPGNFNQHMREGDYQALASQACWMGLALASCAQEFGELLYTFLGKTKNIDFEHNKIPLSSIETTRALKLIENLGNHIVECQRYYKNVKKGFYVTLDYGDEKVCSPLEIAEPEVHKIISSSRERLSFVEPFFAVNLTEMQKRLVMKFFRKAYGKYHFEKAPLLK
jgi:hypothetical protein